MTLSKSARFVSEGHRERDPTWSYEVVPEGKRLKSLSNQKIIMANTSSTTATDSAYAQSCRERKVAEPEEVRRTISALSLEQHPEGGYFVETDRDKRLVPNPFINDPIFETATSHESSDHRNASTSIFYLISPASPVGHFHRNKGRTVHTLHHRKGRYVIVHADRSKGGLAPVESFVVGKNLSKGEKLQWIVEGGKFKASYLLPDDGDTESHGGLLVSETVVPGFDFADHDFMTAEAMEKVVPKPDMLSLSWLLREEERKNLLA